MPHAADVQDLCTSEAGNIVCSKTSLFEYSYIRNLVLQRRSEYRLAVVTSRASIQEYFEHIFSQPDVQDPDTHGSGCLKCSMPRFLRFCGRARSVSG